MIIVIYLLLAFLFGSINAALAASLEDAAKKEGTVAVYGAGNVEHWQKLNAAFEKKYPYLKVNFFRGNWEKVRNRVMTEGRAGSYLVDVLQIDGINGWVLKEEGYLQSYKSAETEAFPDAFRDPSGMLPCCLDTLTNVIGFNTRLVKKQDAPKSYRDLLAPRWKDKLGMDADEGEWFAGLITVWGKEKTVDYFRTLMKQNVSLRRG
ncbi:MAG: ABC transporter substrate-binding protein, partial [Candidatus Binatia bacterium]